MNIAFFLAAFFTNVTATYTGLSELDMRLRVLTKGSWHSWCYPTWQELHRPLLRPFNKQTNDISVWVNETTLLKKEEDNI